MPRTSPKIKDGVSGMKKGYKNFAPEVRKSYKKQTPIQNVHM
jgi:hypothetical protein